MTEDTPNFRPGFELPYKFRAFGELDRLLPTLKQKQREVVTNPEEIEAINEDWNLIDFTEKKFAVVLPILGSDTAALAWIQYPYDDDPLIQVSFEAYSKGLPVTEKDEKGFPAKGYTAFFGSELEPFIIHNNHLEIFTNQPLGEQIAQMQDKRILADAECKAIVGLVAMNVDEVIDKGF